MTSAIDCRKGSGMLKSMNQELLEATRWDHHQSKGQWATGKWCHSIRGIAALACHLSSIKGWRMVEAQTTKEVRVGRMLTFPISIEEWRRGASILRSLVNSGPQDSKICNRQRCWRVRSCQTWIRAPWHKHHSSSTRTTRTSNRDIHHIRTTNQSPLKYPLKTCSPPRNINHVSQRTLRASMQSKTVATPNSPALKMNTIECLSFA